MCAGRGPFGPVKPGLPPHAGAGRAQKLPDRCGCAGNGCLIVATRWIAGGGAPTSTAGLLALPARLQRRSITTQWRRECWTWLSCRTACHRCAGRSLKQHLNLCCNATPVAAEAPRAAYAQRRTARKGGEEPADACTVWLAPPAHSCPWCCSFLPPLPALQLNMVKLSYRTAHAKRLSVEQESLHYQVCVRGLVGLCQGLSLRCALSAVEQGREPTFSAATARLNSFPLSPHIPPQWFADLGNADAAREAARLLAEAAPAGGRNYAQAIRYLNQASANGGWCCVLLCAAGGCRGLNCEGLIFRSVVSITCSPSFAAHCLQAAAAEDSTAMAHLGHIYANGQGVPQDNATAVRWFKKAADHGVCAFMGPSARDGCGLLAMGRLLCTCWHAVLRGSTAPRHWLQRIQRAPAAAHAPCAVLQGTPAACWHLATCT